MAFKGGFWALFFSNNIRPLQGNGQFISWHFTALKFKSSIYMLLSALCESMLRLFAFNLCLCSPPHPRPYAPAPASCSSLPMPFLPARQDACSEAGFFLPTCRQALSCSIRHPTGSIIFYTMPDRFYHDGLLMMWVKIQVLNKMSWCESKFKFWIRFRFWIRCQNLYGVSESEQNDRIWTSFPCKICAKQIGKLCAIAIPVPSALVWFVL